MSYLKGNKMSSFSFNRPELAARLLNSLRGGGFPDFGSDLFLSAPRRTGKTTFLKEDLIPMMRENNIEPIYIDLWSNKEKDTSLLIIEGIKTALIDADNSFLAKVRPVINKISALGVSVDLAKIGQPDGMTISDAISLVNKKKNKTIALIIDEAQHSITSEKGLNAMFALKSARDTLNSTTERNLLLIFTGSHRGRLSALTQSKYPFFGSQLNDFPLLDKSYTNAYTKWVNERLAKDNQFNADEIYEAFRYIGFRPKHLSDIVSQVALSENKSSGFKRMLMDGAYGIREQLWTEFSNSYESLAQNQKNVLKVLIENPDVSIFSEEAINLCGNLSNEEMSKSNIQSSLIALREKTIVFQNSRGKYLLEDVLFAEWFSHHESKMQDSEYGNGYLENLFNH